jgi:hypothetical protein
MTVHFAGTFKNKAGALVVPYCKRFAMSPMWGATTTDTAKVDCKSCAKALGIAPAAKAVAPGAKVGTCQCCFNTQKLPAGRLSHHGYTAPGHGYHVGYCRGERELPFELSCEVTRKWRGEVAGWVAKRVDYLARLEANEVDSITYQTEDRSQLFDRYTGRWPAVMVTVTRYDVPNSPYAYSRITPYDFATAYSNELSTTKAEIADGRAQLAFLDEKIGSWKLVEGF